MRVLSLQSSLFCRILVWSVDVTHWQPCAATSYSLKLNCTQYADHSKLAAGHLQTVGDAHHILGPGSAQCMGMQIQCTDNWTNSKQCHTCYHLPTASNKHVHGVLHVPCMAAHVAQTRWQIEHVDLPPKYVQVIVIAAWSSTQCVDCLAK